MDAESSEFARSFTRYVNAMAREAEEAEATEGRLTEVGQLVQDFLGTALQAVEPVTETFPAHQVVDLDLALDSLLETYRGERQGISGANREHVDSVTEYLVRTHSAFGLGPVSYRRQATGPDTDRRVVTLGIGMLRFDGVPVAWLQRGANRRHGRDEHTLELLCPELDRAEAFMRLVRDEMSRLSILRGQVISFASDAFDYHNPGGSLTFLRRPEVGPDQVVLPAGVLDRVTRHVVGVGEHREALRAAGQHLKRGVLLYGPPGTGKTHLVRHLLSRTPGTTAVLLSGRTLGLLTTATTLARAAQPALIVLEDCDLVAEHRGGDTNAALFETLEAMDGLAADADITFVLTTNRADLLERALVERPGRVDLAVEIPKPDLQGRRRLFRLYGAALLETGGVSEPALLTAAARTEGVTASFAKEAIRRTVINAAQENRRPGDVDLSHALDEMLSDAEALTRSLLGGEAHAFGDDVDPGSDRPAGRPYGGPARPGLHPDDTDGPDWVIGFEEP